MRTKEIVKHLSAIDILLQIREQNRRLRKEEYLLEIGLDDKFKEFSRKKD